MEKRASCDLNPCFCVHFAFQIVLFKFCLGSIQFSKENGLYMLPNLVRPLIYHNPLIRNKSGTSKNSLLWRHKYFIIIFLKTVFFLHLQKNLGKTRPDYQTSSVNKLSNLLLARPRELTKTIVSYLNYFLFLLNKKPSLLMFL